MKYTDAQRLLPLLAKRIKAPILVDPDKIPQFTWIIGGCLFLNLCQFLGKNFGEDMVFLFFVFFFFEKNNHLTFGQMGKQITEENDSHPTQCCDGEIINI